MSDAAEKARLLSILESHGQSFLNSFVSTGNDSKKRKSETIHDTRKKCKKDVTPEEDKDEADEGEDNDEEWFGINEETTDASEDDEDDNSDNGM